MIKTDISTIEKVPIIDSIQKAVIHHNNIATGRFEDFEVREIKLFLSLISSVENDKMEYLFNAKDIKDFIGMNRDSYKVFEKLIKNLQKKTIEVRTGVTTYISYSIFSALVFDTEEKSVRVIYNPMFKPLIMDFKGNFTKYYLKNIQNMKKNSSLIFYIRSKSEFFKGGFNLSIEEIKSIFKVNYKAIKDIDNKIINPAVEEINANTDLKLEVVKIYEFGGDIKKRVAGYSFKIFQNLLMSSDLTDAINFAKKNIYISKSKTLNNETMGIL
ncbi:MAG: replication initiation protein, partial [Fusobacteriaceae bacterium]